MPVGARRLHVRATRTEALAPVVQLSCICSRHCVGVGGGGGWRSLCELTYYHRWLNIGAELLNNKVSDGRTVLDIPDGYYNVCELDKEAFRPLGAELSLHAPTGRLQLSAKKRLILNGGLAKLLGFSLERGLSPARATLQTIQIVWPSIWRSACILPRSVRRRTSTTVAPPHC